MTLQFSMFSDATPRGLEKSVKKSVKKTLQFYFQIPLRINRKSVSATRLLFQRFFRASRKQKKCDPMTKIADFCSPGERKSTTLLRKWSNFRCRSAKKCDPITKMVAISVQKSEKARPYNKNGRTFDPRKPKHRN